MRRWAPKYPAAPLGWDRWINGGYSPGDEMDFHPGDNDDDEVFEEPVAPNARWAFATALMRNFIFSDPEWSYAVYDFSDFADTAASVAQTLDADSPDLSAFRARGGKLIIDNGWMDPSLTPHGTIDYYESVIDFDPTARDDVRLFIRPGVAHCLGGPGPDGTNYIVALEEWLDSGVAPGAARRAVCHDAAGPATDRTGWADHLCAPERRDLRRFR